MEKFLPDFLAVILLMVLLLISGGFIDLFNLPLLISTILTLILWLVLSIVALVMYIRFISKYLDL